MMATDELTSVELAIAEQPQLVIPLSGELVDLRKPNEVANALDQIREMKHQLDGCRIVFEQVLRLEASRQGTKTLHLDECTAAISGGETVEYDGEELGRRLLAAGMPGDRVNEIVQVIVTYKVNARNAKHAAGANPEYAKAVEETRTVKPAPWRVWIKR
jgi:hypothetical protein